MMNTLYGPYTLYDFMGVLFTLYESMSPALSHFMTLWDVLFTLYGAMDHTLYGSHTLWVPNLMGLRTLSLWKTHKPELTSIINS